MTEPEIIQCAMIWKGERSSIAAGSFPYQERCPNLATEQIEVDGKIYDVCRTCKAVAVIEDDATPLPD
jgi:hypothetical protein